MVSTAAGQFRLILDALEIQAFRQILAMPQITLPVAGVAYNVNASLGHDGISQCGRGSGRRAGPTGPSSRSFSSFSPATGWRADPG
jgi:D-alanyl-D-alanine carboxypeptidase (penicillin-binding protein 5/6)